MSNKAPRTPAPSEDLVQCLLCSKWLKAVNNMHLKTHHVTPAEYKERFPHAEITSPLTRWKIAQSMLDNEYWVGKHHKPESVEKLLANRDYKHGPQALEKMSEKAKGNTRAQGLKHTEETKRDISHRNKAWWAKKKALYGNLTQGGKPVAALVQCLICGKQFRALNNSHLAMHGLTPAEYKERFPHAEITSPLTRWKIGQAELNNKYGVGRHPKPESIEKLLANRNYRHGPETLARMREKALGNKNAQGLKHTAKTKRQISERNKEWHAYRRLIYGPLTSTGKPKLPAIRTNERRNQI